VAPALSVIVPVRDEARVLARTLPTILGQDVGDDVEFLLVDGRSSDGTPELLRRAALEDPRVRVLDNPLQTLAGALQVGMAHARGRMVAKMDAHTFFAPDYLRLAVQRLGRGDVHWVSGPAIPFAVGPGSKAVAAALGTKLGIGGASKWPSSARGEQAEWDLDTGVFSGVMTRSALERVGAWDPGWPANEDAELASRFLRAGERVLCVGGMGARYMPRESLRGLARQYGRYGFYRVKTARRHPPSMRRSHVLPPGVVLALAASVIAPAPVRGVARAASAAYAAAIVHATATAASSHDPATAVRLPATFAAMHLGYGVGWLLGCARFGVPGGALWRVARGRAGRWEQEAA